MGISHTAVLQQIDAVLEQCSLRSPKGYDDFSDLPLDTVIAAINTLLAAIDRLAPSESSYKKSAAIYGKGEGWSSGRSLLPLIGILKSLRSDYASGRLQTVQELIHAEIFADFLDMAAYLLGQGFKDPAAVIVGSVLEEHLRKLGSKHGISSLQSSGSPKKADTLNAELAAAGVYNKLDQKGVLGWLDLRNQAAHGHYTEYKKEQVSLMLQSVQDFMIRNAA